MANDPVDPMITIQEMLRNMCRDIAGLKDEVTHLKDQSTQKVSTSKDPTIQPPPATSPNLTRPVISPVEIDLEDEQYAGEYFVPPVNKENELFDKYEKMARDIESMKVQASKGFDISEFLVSPNAIFPPKFKAPDYDKYDGTGCPRNHVRWFITLSQQHGLSREQMAHLFPMSLIGVAKRWFLRLKPEEIRTLEEISNRFVEQFSMEEGIEVTKRDLKLLKQNPQETFTSFIRRWRRKSAQLSHRMSEEDQIKLVLKSLSPQYFHFMAPQHYQNFDHLIKTGTQIEDAIAKGLRAKTLSDVREGKRPMIQPKEVQAVSYTRPVAKPVDEVVRPMVTKQFRQFDPLPFPLPMILKKLIRDKKIRLPDVKPVPNPLPGNWRRDQYCEYHRGPGHMTENCLALKHAIQNMIDKDELAVERPNITQNPLPNHRAVAPPTTNAIFVDEPILDPSTLICAITSDKTYVLKFDDEELREFREKEPYVLSFDDAELTESSSAQSYALQNVGLEEAKEATYVLRMEDFEEDVSNAPYVFRTDEDELLLLDDQCNEMRHMTRGGRVFKPPELSVENPAGVARNSENQRQNKVSADEEDESLLKQLKKTQANISVWGLLMASSKHRKLVLQELNAAQVSVNTSPDELVSLVAMARAAKTLSFADDDLPPEGRDHTKPLKITVFCNKKKVPEVLVDNGSALNVCPLSTAATLGFSPENFIPSEQGILAYDGTRRDVIGTLVTEIQIGGEDFEVEFQVLDIKASFLLLLGRPWMHKVGVVPSTLHQKLKFIRRNRVITVKGDPDLEIGQITPDITGERSEDINLTGFSLEVTTITFKEALNEEICFLTSTNSNVIRMIRRQGYMPGAGLGKYHQGLTEFPVFKTFNGLFGLGYKPTKKEIVEMKQLMLKWAENRRRGLGLPMAPIDLKMNGRFRKEGAAFPFCGFAEFWLDESTGQMLPGFEIFFDLELEDEPVGMQIVETESEADWTEHIEPSLLNSLFQEGSQTVAVIGRSPLILDPTRLITPAEEPLTNWTSQVLPQVIFQYKRIPSEKSVVHKYVSVSGFDSESIFSNESFDAVTIDDHSPEIGDVSSFSSEIELESVHNKASVAVSFYSPESVDAGVNISIESVKMSPKFIVPPDEGNSSVDVYDSNSNEMKDSSFEYIPVYIEGIPRKIC
ncbi:uncharacterized protein LOC143891726 [Tasmannia lanceolata]|uniref:uncharacterized protein LOC143891726 n=2 Tax=Tasmannia lanceolata TaxID=3420 RepID=UPI004062B093